MDKVSLKLIRDEQNVPSLIKIKYANEEDEIRLKPDDLCNEREFILNAIAMKLECLRYIYLNPHIKEQKVNPTANEIKPLDIRLDINDLSNSLIYRGAIGIIEKISGLGLMLSLPEEYSWMKNPEYAFQWIEDIINKMLDEVNTKQDK